ncbi:MAG: DUF6125 family protein [Armatimonadota bacterium]|jgi:hypothetical protein
MPGFDPKLLVEYLRRSYHAVDGLWFVTTEEEHGFDHALDIDRRVWSVVAKIQARKARELLGADTNSPDDLARCFTLKLTADGHIFRAEIHRDEVRFLVTQCPWLELLRKSGRQHLAARISQTICPTEGNAWATEFGGEYDFRIPAMSCSGDSRCSLTFVRKTA